MSHRFDHRDKKEFCSDIKRATLIEKWLIEKYVYYYNLRFKEWNLEFKDNGVDNTGEFTDKPNSNCDYIFHYRTNDPNFKMDRLVEVKTSPIGNDHKSTFKVGSMLSTIKQNAWLLVFYNVATKSNNFITDTKLEDVYFTWVSPETQAKMLGQYPHKTYGKIMGGKPSIQVPSIDYHKWFEFISITDQVIGP